MRIHGTPPKLYPARQQVIPVSAAYPPYNAQPILTNRRGAPVSTDVKRDCITHAVEGDFQEPGGVRHVAIDATHGIGHVFVLLQSRQARRSLTDLECTLPADNPRELPDAIAAIFHCVIPGSLGQAFLAPLCVGRARLLGRIEWRRHLIRCELQAFLRGQIVIILFEISTEAELRGQVLGHTNVAEARILQRHAILRVPTFHKPPAGLDWNSADRGTVVHPSRIPKPHPGLGVRLLHIFNPHAADPIGQHVILRAGNRVRQIV